jgi:hypothetical protein
MQRYGVNEMDLVPLPGEPGSVRTRTSSHISHDFRRREQMSPDQRLRSGELQYARRSARQPTALLVLFVVVRDDLRFD